MTTESAVVEDTFGAYGDDALAEIAVEMAAEGRRLLQMAGQADLELRRRMSERQATHLETMHYTGLLKPGSLIHEVADEAMMLLKKHVPPAVWAVTYVQKPPPPPVWDHRSLNELVKLGGKVREIIDAARTSRRGDPRLELKKKEMPQ